MRLALLTGANPRASRGGPLVRLLAGRWRIISEGMRDSVLSLHVHDGRVLSVPHDDFHLHERGPVQLHFVTRGSESHISVYAEKVA